MATNFPTSKDDNTTLPNPAGTNTQNNPDHAAQHANENDAIKAIETKVGTGNTAPAANTLLFGTGAGTSAWQQLTSAQLAASLTDETGTGAAVFANTPVLITPKVDTINENTPGNGVTVSGVSLKSGAIAGSSLSTTGAATIGNGLTVSAGVITAPNGSLSSKALTNPHKFCVYRSAALNSSNADTVIAMDTKVYDTGTNVDVVTNKGRFTAPVAGFYWFAANAGNNAATSTLMSTSFFKNGSKFLAGNELSPSNAGTLSSVTGVLQLAANDFVEPAFVGGAGSSMTVGQAFCYFMGFLVSQT